ncbi:uncharacterized protein SCHCODRAFT_01093881 [Schizophyllum commune H4-8]|nr:uncharacterized protein SCHCODRAFT_01093881 [Schizophyllum commune H4-8]KAI5891901.1 hypothetical protein SCHCODRAFT_01093881 [Schizophyllum commune H4-8]
MDIEPDEELGSGTRWGTYGAVPAAKCAATVAPLLSYICLLSAQRSRLTRFAQLHPVLTPPLPHACRE